MNDTRKYWVGTLLKIVTPVLSALAEGKLKEKMPVEMKIPDRPAVTHLEALGRTVTGLAPWLETAASDPWEEQLRVKTAGLARKAIANATDPSSPDFCNFTVRIYDDRYTWYDGAKPLTGDFEPFNYINADIFCLPSLWEGLSIAMLEAMAMKKAMVVTLTDGARDIITNEQNAIVVQPRQPESLAEAIVRCAADSRLRSRLGHAAYKLVRQRFDSQRVANSVAQIYKDLAS